MCMGIIIKGMNSIYFKDYPTFFSEVIPGLIILLGLFGYMDVLIFGKWLSYIDIENDEPWKPEEYKTIVTDSSDPDENRVPISTGDY